jgi:hypothetical protein
VRQSTCCALCEAIIHLLVMVTRIESQRPSQLIYCAFIPPNVSTFTAHLPAYTLSSLDLSTGSFTSYTLSSPCKPCSLACRQQATTRRDVAASQWRISGSESSNASSVPCPPGSGSAVTPPDKSAQRDWDGDHPSGPVNDCSASF